MSIENLIDLCEKQKIRHFTANENEGLYVVAPAVYETVEDKSDDFTLYGKVQILHVGKNRNGSNVTEDAAKGILDTVKYKPLLANFCEVDGERDFTSHDFEVDEDGNIEYIERQIGCFTADDAFLEEDEDKGKTYVVAYVAIPREYTDAAEIIERKEGTKISAELLVNEMEYDSEKKELLFTDIELLGATCLGKNPDTGEDVEEGMEGAFLSISFDKKTADMADFYKDHVRKEEDSMDKEKNFNNEVVEEETEPVVNSTETEEVTETETEVVETETEEVVETETEAEAEDTDNEVEVEEADEEEFSATIKFGKNVKTYDLNVDEKIRMLQDLVNRTYEDDWTYYNIQLFEPDGYVVMTDYWSYIPKHYKQYVSYNEDGLYQLEGERFEVSPLYVTSEEEALIKEARASYDASKKAEVLDSEDYDLIHETEEFAALYNFEGSIQELKDKADQLLLDKVKTHKDASFAAHKIGSTNAGKKPSRYGNLFTK